METLTLALSLLVKKVFLSTWNSRTHVKRRGLSQISDQLPVGTRQTLRGQCQTVDRHQAPPHTKAKAILLKRRNFAENLLGRFSLNHLYDVTVAAYVLHTRR